MADNRAEPTDVLGAVRAGAEVNVYAAIGCEPAGSPHGSASAVTAAVVVVVVEAVAVAAVVVAPGEGTTARGTVARRAG